MRAEVIFGNKNLGRFDFAVSPAIGDSIQVKESVVTVESVIHNTDIGRVQLLCKSSSEKPRGKGPMPSVEPPAQPKEEEPPKAQAAAKRS